MNVVERFFANLIAAASLTNLKNLGIVLFLVLVVGVGTIIYYFYVKSLRPKHNNINNSGRVSNRRNFLIGVFVLALAGVVAQFLLPLVELLRKGTVIISDISSGQGTPPKIANVAEMPPDSQVSFILRRNPDGSPGQHPAILIRLPEDKTELVGKEFVAYSAVCTHLGCIVSYKSEEGVLFCPCHAGYFDPTNGKVISGPPKKPLPEVKLRIDENGDIYAEGWV
ncbi:MAG: Rieske 2Fe-2S domain-containing protein [Nitrososphaerota archaeon]|nr:Rieske 2Fe-2S domain-containing protein [Aigarchaeota archaeon]MDW8076126.1 Rieske 2Fe-2S domain-containing protein [Nitrososphaerota archaeon]